MFFRGLIIRDWERKKRAIKKRIYPHGLLGSLSFNKQGILTIGNLVVSNTNFIYHARKGRRDPLNAIFNETETHQ